MKLGNNIKKPIHKLGFFKASSIIFWIASLVLLAYYVYISERNWLTGIVYEHPISLNSFVLALAAIIVFITFSITIDRLLFSNDSSTTGLVFRISLLIAGLTTLSMAYLSTELQFQKRFNSVNSQYAQITTDQRVNSNLEFKNKQLLAYYYSDINNYYTAEVSEESKTVKRAYTFNQQQVPYILLFLALTCFANYTYLLLAYRSNLKLKRKIQKLNYMNTLRA